MSEGRRQVECEGLVIKKTTTQKTVFQTAAICTHIFQMAEMSSGMGSGFEILNETAFISQCFFIVILVLFRCQQRVRFVRLDSETLQL